MSNAVKYGIDYKNGILNKGNWHRLARVMKKAMGGEENLSVPAIVMIML